VKKTLLREKLGVTIINTVPNIFARFVFPNCGFKNNMHKYLLNRK
jgi:hypothetical protein